MDKIKRNIENELRDRFHKVRNQIKPLKIKTTILRCIQELHNVNINNLVNKNIFKPWYLLFFIRLVFIYGEKKYPYKELNKNKLIKIYNLIHDIGNLNRFMERKNWSDVVKFFRTISFQQFWFQRDFYFWDINHQLQLFCKIEWEKYDVNDVFYKYTGISIYDFIELSLATLTYFKNEDHKIYLDACYYSTIKNYNYNIIIKYLNLISLNENGAKNFAERNFNERKIDLHITEESPFSSYPMINYNELYYCYSPELLSLGLKNFIYDFLKREEESKFCEKFGFVFEKYIELGLKSENLKYITEREIKTLFKGRRGKSKVVDFIVDMDKCSLIIEAKAVEMNYFARINPENEILSERLKSNIIKAVQQIYTLIDFNNNEKIIGSINNKELFVFIITYRQHYLGPCEDLWEEFLYVSLESFFQNNNISPDILNPGRIFFIDIEEFDRFIHCIHYGDDPYNILNKAFDFNINAQKGDKKYTFTMHLENKLLTIDNCPKYASEHFQSMYNKLFRKFKNNI